jgi:hypothetical protein
MHLITQPVYLVACSNCPRRVIMGATEYFPRVSLLAFRIPVFLACSPNVKPPWRREQREGRFFWPYHAFTVVWCPGFMVVTPSFTQLSISFSNQRLNNFSPTVDVGFVKLMLDSFCGNIVFKINIQFCCPVTCTAVVLSRFWTSPRGPAEWPPSSQDLASLDYFCEVTWVLWCIFTGREALLDSRTLSVSHVQTLLQLHCDVCALVYGVILPCVSNKETSLNVYCSEMYTPFWHA